MSKKRGAELSCSALVFLLEYISRLLFVVLTCCDLIKKIEAEYSQEEIVSGCKVLNQSYNIFDLPERQWQQLAYSFPRSISCLQKLSEVCSPGKVINALLMKYYPCERVIKYYLIKKMTHLTENIVAFEMSIGSSRIDLCRINGHTYAYEIKTEYDTFKRLSTQLPNYQKAFDFVYVVTPLQRVESLKPYLPEGCGIIAYTLKNGLCKFSHQKKAEKNKGDLDFCIKNFSSSELTMFIEALSNLTCPTKRIEKEKIAISLVGKRNAWAVYRKILKKRYEKKRNFLVANMEHIQPNEIQEFFRSTMSVN